MSKHTAICWTDIPVANLDRAIAFYSAVFDSPVKKENANGHEFGLLPGENEKMPGCLAVCADNQPSDKGPLIYLSVDDRLDDAIQAAQDNGGKVLTPKESIAPWGFRAVILDSEGNRIALHSETA